MHAINPQKRTIKVVLRRANTMQENIRRIVEAAERPGLQVRRVPHPCRALVLEARVGDDKGQPCPCLWSSHAAPPPPQNVAKSVAKARKNTQVTTSQHQPHQQHTRHFPQKTPHPPPFSAKPGVRRTPVVHRRCQSTEGRNRLWRTFCKAILFRGPLKITVGITLPTGCAVSAPTRRTRRCIFSLR